MSRTVSSFIGSGITLSAGDNPLIVTQSGAIQSSTIANAVTAATGTTTPWVISNDGTIASLGGEYGILLGDVGTIDNGLNSTSALLFGNFDGLIAAQANTLVQNDGTIQSPITGFSALLLQSSGNVINGSDSNNIATISGGIAAVFGVGQLGLDNRGTLTTAAPGGYGVLMTGGGSVNNGTAANGVASISGSNAIANFAGAASLTNAGIVNGTGAYGVFFAAGGSVANGSATAPGGSISGIFAGVYITGGQGTVSNYGRIVATGLAGVLVDIPGTITNGTASNTSASIIAGTAGVFWTSGSATVNNFGTINATAAFGMIGVGGGAITNGSASDTVATISGAVDGFFIFAGVVTLANFGTVSGVSAFGILTTSSTTVSNAGTISGGSAGVVTLGTGTIANSGVISGGSGGAGVWLSVGGSLANSGQVTGGAQGVLINGAGGTVTNSGTISGTVGIAANGENTGSTSHITNTGRIASSSGATGVAVQLGDPGASLVMGTGSSLVGTVAGAGDTTVELAGSTGSIGALAGIGTLLVDAGTSWTLSGSDILSTTGTLVLSGAVTLGAGGTLAAAGSLIATSGGSVNFGGNGSQAFVISAGADGGTGSSFSTPLSNFGSGDRIELRGVTGSGNLTVRTTAGVGSTGTLSVLDGSGATVYTVSSISLSTAGLIYDVGINPANGATEIVAGTSAASFGTPSITAFLANDTGNPADGITYDDSITGTVTAPIGVGVVTATMDAGTKATDVTSFLNNGTLALTTLEMAKIAGGSLLEGSHVLHLTVADVLGHSASTAVSFLEDSGLGVRIDQIPAQTGPQYVATNGTLMLTGEGIDNVAAIVGITAKLDTGNAVALTFGANNAFSLNTATLFGGPIAPEPTTSSSPPPASAA